jgi:hypothetical protein
MGTPLNRRPNNVFLSHSSRDKLDFVDSLHGWLTRKAGLSVWYDRNLVSGPVATNLGQAIDSCKAAIIVLSENSVQSRWVESEYNLLEEERANGDFRIATIRLGTVEAPGLLRSFKHIDVVDGQLTAGAAAVLMDSLFGGRDRADGLSVYLSRGWRPSDREAAERLCNALQASGLRLVCDWTDQPHYDEGRVRGIMKGTGGLVAVLPHRGEGQTSNYIIAEIAAAIEIGLPVLVFADRDVIVRPQWSLSDVVFFDSTIGKAKDAEIVAAFGNRIEDFVRSWRKPSHGEHIFLGHSLNESINDKFLSAHAMLSHLTGLPLKVGGLVAGRDVQSDIVGLIRAAELCIVDITNSSHPDLPPKIDFGLNSSIEAGIALGADRSLYLTCRGLRRSPPFMFRNKQVWFYEDDLAMIGVLRQIASENRRMVL